MALVDISIADVKAPRYRQDKHDILGSTPLKWGEVIKYHKEGMEKKRERVVEVKENPTEFYDKLKKKYPNLKKYKNTDIAGYITRFNEHLTRVICSTREGIVLPEYIGDMFLGVNEGNKYIGKKRKLHHKNSTVSGKACHFRNAHSNNLGASVFYVYNQNRMNFENCQYWYFTPSRKFGIHIKEAMMENWKRFILVPNFKHINNFIASYWKRVKMENKVASELKNYNEFDI